jgi:hypothetical protein
MRPLSRFLMLMGVLWFGAEFRLDTEHKQWGTALGDFVLTYVLFRAYEDYSK